MANFYHLVKIDKTWEDLKNYALTNNLFIRFDTIINTDFPYYEIFVLESQIAYVAVIYTGTVINGINQITNDADKIDFETNFKNLIIRPIIFGDSYTHRYYIWTTFKAVVSSKHINHQYNDDGYVYTIYGYDGPEVHRCIIYKGTVPNDVIITYSQVQNDADKLDFETNYKPFSNRPLIPKAAIILGYTTSTGSALTVMRATAYIEQTTNAQRSILSSSTSDTSAGTGARTIAITYYDQALLGPFIETISMNGTSSVNTVATNICFIEKIEVITVGNQLSNVGTITLKAATAGGGVTIGTIPAGDGITNWCHHYVGAGKTMQIISALASIKGAASGTLELHRTVPNSNKPELTIAPKLRTDAGDSDTLSFEVPIIVQGPALVVAYGRSDASSGNLDWSVGIGYYEA
jgi:hypothetical protein